MPNLLGLTWNKHQLIGLDAQVAKTGIRITGSFVLPWPDDIDLAEHPQQAGQWLRTQLDRLGIRSKRALVALSREETVVRSVEVPNVSPEMLPGLVRYQAGEKSSLPLDQLVLDFVPSPERPATGGRAVLMATVVRQTIDDVQALVHAAGLEVATVGMDSLAGLELVARVQKHRGYDPTETNLVVAGAGERIDISLMKDRHVLFTHAARLAGKDQQQSGRIIGGEVSRALMAFETVQPDVHIDRVWLVGSLGEYSGLSDELRQRLDSDVAVIDSLDELGVDFAAGDRQGDATQFMVPLGLLLARSGALIEETIDFQRPRQPATRRSRRKLLLAVGVAAAVLAVVVGYAGQYLYLRALDNSIEQKHQEQQQLDLVLKQGQPVLRAAATIGEWKGRDVNWMEQMEAVSSSMPDAERMYLETLRLQPSVGETIARIQADGYARERGDVETLNQELADLQGLRVRPKKIQSGPAYEAYPVRFEVDADVVSPAQQSVIRDEE